MHVDEHYYSNLFYQLRNYSSNHSDIIFPMHKCTGCILPFTIIYGYWGIPLKNFSNTRHVLIMKTVDIGGELIYIVCVHTECTLTAMHIQSIHFHKLFEACWRWIISQHGIIWALYICIWSTVWSRNDKLTKNKCYIDAWLR